MNRRDLLKLGGACTLLGISQGCGSNATLPKTAVTQVDATSPWNKLLFGYQGWFGTPRDTSELNEWQHWSFNKPISASSITFDIWPDVGEFKIDDLSATGLKLANGNEAYLFSSFKKQMVDTHFRWMQSYGIDGVFLQEFVLNLVPGSKQRQFRDVVTENVMQAASSTGRVVAIMYDVTGANPTQLISLIRSHIQANSHLIFSNDRYLHYNSKPLIGIWGLGFVDRNIPVGVANATLDYLESEGIAVMGGVPTFWRQAVIDSQTGPEWSAFYKRYSLLSPWTVGRYSNSLELSRYVENTLSKDISYANSFGSEIVPVVFPGLSNHNVLRVENPNSPPPPINSIPRLNGNFWWNQMSKYSDLPAKSIYGAMFDEVDEGTAMFKIQNNERNLPVGLDLLSNAVSGDTVPNDWYLTLAGKATALYKSGSPITLNFLNALLKTESLVN
ncbi:MAG: hypothetical protein HKL80_06915 [Acidimicrobiales bacterium]|nr:hypothetical protein [Acidimicrobiales bacterium]